MFDVGFSELLVIGVVALLVLGPERLPRLARDVGRWVGRARRYANRVREEIDREVELGELRRLRDEIEANARAAANEVDAATQVVEQAVQSTLDQVAQPTPAPAVAPNVVNATAEAPKARRKRIPDGASPAVHKTAPDDVQVTKPRKRASRRARTPAEGT